MATKPLHTSPKHVYRGGCHLPYHPSSTMAEYVDEWAVAGRKNIPGETVMVQEMQSEGGRRCCSRFTAGRCPHYHLTASQGLLLMIPNMYKIAGELLPCVFHVSARTLPAQPLHLRRPSDVMSTRQTALPCWLKAACEVMDSPVCSLASIKSRMPFVNFS